MVPSSEGILEYRLRAVQKRTEKKDKSLKIAGDAGNLGSRPSDVLGNSEDPADYCRLSAPEILAENERSYPPLPKEKYVLQDDFTVVAGCLVRARAVVVPLRQLGRVGHRTRQRLQKKKNTARSPANEKELTMEMEKRRDVGASLRGGGGGAKKTCPGLASQVNARTADPAQRREDASSRG